MANALISIQIIPKPKNGEDVYHYVDEAIKIIEDSGVKYQVSPLETTMEGELYELMNVIGKMNERMTEMGSSNVVSQVKILYQPTGVEMSRLTEKYR
ncbi:thiamine-binding protein [Bacillus sp. FSL K6-3431]|uniref:thiamine-binding protein n=1 Tax=Bacillus sp. FSL K6-3431 TaxID=2921500 RepID=UPI0030F76F52